MPATPEADPRMPGTGLYLAFDYGEKRIGIAIGNRWSGEARPLTTLTCGDAPPWDGIEHLISEWHPQALIVGLPRQRDGSEQAMAARVRAFVGEMEQRFRLPVHTVDERWSSSAAASRLREARRSGEMTRRVRKGDDDALAAQVILQDYLGAPPCT